MIQIITQNGQSEWRIEAFWIKEREDPALFEIVGLARINLSDTQIVSLGVYLYHSQAMDVFAQIDRLDNDLLYFRTQNKRIYWMPEAITDEREIMRLYGAIW